MSVKMAITSDGNKVMFLQNLYHVDCPFRISSTAQTLVFWATSDLLAVDERLLIIPCWFSKILMWLLTWLSMSYC